MMLASLYHDLDDFVYVDSRSISSRVTLLHIWALEHIAVLHPVRIILVDMELDDPVIWRYRGALTFSHTREIGIWHLWWVIDEMTIFKWRPYLGQLAWYDDIQLLFFSKLDQLMQGREQTMIERYFPDRVAHQFGDTLDRPNDQYVAIFAHTTRDMTWGLTILVADAVKRFMLLVAKPLPYDQGQENPITTLAYRDWFHPPVRLTVPSALLLRRRPRGQGVEWGDNNGNEDDGGKGRG